MKGKVEHVGGAVLAVLLMFGAAAAVLARPLDGPVPPPGVKPIECITVDMDGAQLYHLVLPKPLTDKAAVMAAFVRFGQELQLRALVTREERIASDGRRIVEAATKKGDYTPGSVCYVLMKYCDPSCTGNGCATLRVPSVQ